MRATRVAVTLAAAFLALPAQAGGSLQGRIVTLYTLTYDDPAAPILESRGRTVKVDGGVAFGMGPEFRTPGFDIVPVEIEIDPARISFAYPDVGRGDFYVAAFNGYVLRFETECALFEAVSINRDETTMPMTDADITSELGALYINVSGREYGPDMRLVLDLVVGDCPLS